MGHIGTLVAHGNVGNGITIIPCHINAAGKAVSAKLSFDVLVNKFGSEEAVPFHISCWGGLAISLARFLHTGKSLLLELEPRVYKGRVFLPNPQGGRGTPAMFNGSPLLVTKTGWEIAKNNWSSIELGTDAPKIVASEIQQGLRPADWNSTNEGRAAWAAKRDAWKKINLEIGMTKFFYADIDISSFGTGTRYPVSDAEFEAARGASGNVTATAIGIMPGTTPGMGTPINPGYSTAAPVYNPPTGVTMEQVMAMLAGMTKNAQPTSNIPGMPGTVNGTPGTAVANVFGAGQTAAPGMPGGPVF